MRDKRLATAVATLLAAFATAHLMQFGLSAGRLVSDGEQAAPIGLATLVVRPDPDLPPDPTAPATSAPRSAADPAPAPPALPPAGDRTGLRDGARASDAGRDCARSLTARRAPGAVLRAELRAPCDPGMRVRFAHAGLRFTLVTGDDGRAAVDIPAMQTAAMVEARFADGAVLAAETAVPSAAEFDRLAVVTEGWYGLTLHARVRQGGKGHITQLGDAPRDADLVTEVFTAPSGRFGSLGGVSLELELPVNPVNCGRDIQADIIRSGEGAPVVLGLSVPSCDAVGETVVLPLRPADPRLAQNRG